MLQQFVRTFFAPLRTGFVKLGEDTYSFSDAVRLNCWILAYISPPIVAVDEYLARRKYGPVPSGANWRFIMVLPRMQDFRKHGVAEAIRREGVREGSIIAQWMFGKPSA